MSNLRVTARFKSSGVPTSSLSPTVTIYNRSNDTTPISSAGMTDIGDGFYEYLFTKYNSSKDYLFSFDGTATLSNSDRYLETDISSIDDIVSAIGVLRSGGFFNGRRTVSAKIDEEAIRELIRRVVGAVEMLEINIPEIMSQEEIRDFREQAIEERKKSIQELKDMAKKSIERINRDITRLTDEQKKNLSRVATPIITKEEVKVVTEKMDLNELKSFIVDAFDTFGEFIKQIKK